MAKLQPLTKSEIYLTDIQHVGAAARYLWSSFIYDDPQDAMKVAVTGFLNPTNNINDQEITAVDLNAQWFEVTFTTQVPETHIALARAGETLNATCAHITKPLWSSAVKKSANANGCYWQNHPKPRPREQKPGFPYWEAYYSVSIRKERRRLLSQISKAWKNTLSAGQRADWNALAAGVTWVNYKGTQRNGNGFELFQAVQTQWRYVNGMPWFMQPIPQWPIYLDAPAIWDPPAAPTLANAVLQFDAYITIDVNNAPADPQWWSGQPTIQKGRTPGTKRHKSFHPVRDYLSDFGYTPPQLWVPLDFPFSTLNKPVGSTICYRFCNLNTGVFSDPSFITWP